MSLPASPVRNCGGLASRAASCWISAAAADRPLVLVLDGWLRFGGGMATSRFSRPGFAFPVSVWKRKSRCRGESASHDMEPMEVTVGAPCGKPKTIMVDLAKPFARGHPPFASEDAYELHWTKSNSGSGSTGAIRITRLAPSRTDLHWRGFSDFQPWPDDLPLTPITTRCDRILIGESRRPVVHSLRTVDELVARRTMPGADQWRRRVDLDVCRRSVAPLPAALFENSTSTRWLDKDSDFHVVCGATVEPLPFHGMDDQLYGRQARPVLDDA